MSEDPSPEPPETDAPEPEQDSALNAAPDDSQTGHKCPECERSFDNMGSLNLHFHSAHGRAKQVKDKYCSECNAGPYYESDLKAHISKKHRGDSVDKNAPLPVAPVATPESPETQTPIEPDDGEPVFKGPRTEQTKRRRRLEQALGIFDLKDKAKRTILNVWDNYQDVRNDDREFHTFLMDIDGIEPSQARRIVDMVFGEGAAPPPDPYYPRRRQGEPNPNYPTQRGYRGEPAQAPYYQYPTTYGPYDNQMYPMAPMHAEPPVPKGYMTQDEFERRWDERKKSEELEKKERQIQEMQDRLARIEAGPPQNQNQGTDPRDARLEELEKEIERVKAQKEMEAIKTRYDGRFQMLERELEQARSAPKDMVTQLERAGALGQKPGLGDNAQVAITELNKKADTLTHTMDNFTDVLKTWITMQSPMNRRPGSAMSQDEMDAARRELGG